MVKDRRLLEVIEYISAVDAELEVVSELITRYQRKHEGREKRFALMVNSLRAIRKVNEAAYKDGAIDALCDYKEVADA